MTPVKITQSIVEELKSKLDIVNVVGERVPLKKSGANYKGLCPFHQEKTPSFMVNPDKQIFRCFGCNTGGDVISFVEKLESLSFYEAVVKLAEQAGIKLPETHVNDYTRQAQDKRQSMVEINAIARDHYAQKLRIPGNKALLYARERNLSEQTIKDFYIGYAADSWDELAVELTKKNKSLSMTADLGLIKEKNGKYYDTFRDRLMFPILNHRGETVAFGGRALTKTEDSPKYLNSKESELYKKGEVLYGLYLTGKPIRDTGFAVVVEGYMDFISLYQAGIKNIVATLGTAFTEKQVNILKRYTDRVVLFFDSDEAGVNASKRSLAVLLENGFKTDALIIDGVKDPDDAIKILGKDKLEKMLQDAKPLISRLITEKFSGQKNLNDLPKSISDVLSYIGLIQDNVSRNFWTNELAMTSRMNKRELDGLLRGYIKTKSPSAGTENAVRLAKTGKVPPLYKSTIRVLLSKSELCQIVFDEGWDAFIPQDLAELIYRIKNIYNEKQTVTIDDWFFTAKEAGYLWLEEFITKELFGKKGLHGMDADTEFHGCMTKFKMNTLEEKRQESLKKIKEGETEENTLREYKAIVKEMNQLKGQERT
ncbi:MAG: DNA primase [Pseudomonadota bacterium]